MRAKVQGNAYRTDLFGAKFAINQAPKLSVDKTKDIVKWGIKNDYPSKLLFWFNNDAEHGAICRGKSRYITGLSIHPKEENGQAEQWLKYANPTESWYDLTRKLDMDEVLSGGYFLKIVSNALGQPLHYYHLDFAKCRISECGQYVRYSNDWSKFDESITTFPVWDKNTYGTSVFVYKQYVPTATKLSGTYPQPEYLSCTLDIDTDVRISTFGNSLVGKNFSAGHIVTVFNGQKDPKAQKDLSERIKGNHAGEENTGDTVVIFTDVNGKATEITAVPTNDLDKQYEAISKRNQQKKLTGHNVSGVLFKIKTEGQLGNRAELIEAHELFINEYAKVKQEAKLIVMQMFYKLRFGVEIEFIIEQVQPIGYDWLNPEVSKHLNQDEIRDKLGLGVADKKELTQAEITNAAINALSPLVANKVIESMSEDEVRALAGLPSKNILVDDNGVQTKAPSVNENLKGLSGRESQDMLRIVRQFDKGQMTRQQAILRLTSGYGLTEVEASKFLNENDDNPATLSSHVCFASDDKFISLFNKYAHDVNEDDEILNVTFLYKNVKLEEEVSKEVRDNVLAAVKADPTADKDSIAKDLKIEQSIVEKALESLRTLKLIELIGNVLKPTQKGLDYDIKSEIYTEYVYAKRPDVTGPIIKDTTRQFCRDMVQLTRRRALSFEAINKLTNEFKQNAWDYRGGFYNNGTETTPWCRHVWSAVTKIRRK